MFKEFSDDSRSEEFLNEFRQKMADQTASNIEERQNELRKSRSVFIGTLAGLILAGAIGGFILAPRYNKDFAGDVPFIKRPTEAVKVAPTDRGGMQIENQDKSIYGLLDKSHEESEEFANIVPVTEEPKLPVVIGDDDEFAPNSMDEIIESAEAEVLNDVSNISAGRNGETAAQETSEKFESIAEINPANKEKMNEIKASVDNKIKEAKTEAPAEAAVATGNWQIQIMSSKNKESVEKSWKDLQAKHAFFKGLPYEIEKADLGSSGIYYRLKAGAFADKSAADAVCEKFKAAKGSCIVKKK